MFWTSDSRQSDGPRVEVSSAQSASRPKPQRSPPLRWLEPDFLSPRSERLIRIAGKLVGAAGAALFAKASVQYYLHTHSFIGAAFLVEQMWVVVAYLI